MSDTLNNKILIIIYDDVQSFPPTLNHILYFISQGFEVQIISRNIKNLTWDFTEKVSERRVSSSSKSGKIYSISNFIRFQLVVIKYLISKKYSKFILYDFYSSLAFLLGTIFNSSKREKSWYHSHDCAEPKEKSIRLYLRNIIESKIILSCFGFSFPSKDRIYYYKGALFHISKFVEIPNYPSNQIFKDRTSKSLKNNNKIKVVFCGALSENRGIIEFIDVLDTKMSERDIELHLYTYESSYRERIEQKIADLNLEKKVIFHDPLSYFELSKKLIEYDLGLAFYKGENVMDQTSAKGSNKIFEYGANGIPVLVLDNVKFRNELNQFNNWIQFVSLDKNQILSKINHIISNYNEISKGALSDINFFNSERQLNRVPFFNNQIIK